MKKMMLVLFFAVTVFHAHAQTEQGKVMIGGLISGSGTNNTNDGDLSNTTTKSYGIKLSPNVGYFIKDNLAVGFRASFGVNDNKYTINNYPSISPGNNPYNTYENIHSTSYGIAGFTRYYKKLGEHFSLFADGSVAYTYTDKKDEYNYSSLTTSHSLTKTYSNTIGATIAPGLVYFVNNRLGIEATYGGLFYTYSTSRANSDNNNGGKTFNTNYGLNLNFTSFQLGMNYYF